MSRGFGSQVLGCRCEGATYIAMYGVYIAVDIVGEVVHPPLPNFGTVEKVPASLRARVIGTLHFRVDAVIDSAASVWKRGVWSDPGLHRPPVIPFPWLYWGSLSFLNGREA